MMMVECAQCKKEVDTDTIIYCLDEKFFIEGSVIKYPFCSCACGTKFYDDNGYNNMDTIKGIKA